MVLSNSIDGVRQYPQFSIEIHEVSIQRVNPLRTAFIRLKIPVVKYRRNHQYIFVNSLVYISSFATCTESLSY